MSFVKRHVGICAAGLMLAAGTAANAATAPPASHDQIFAHINFNGAVIYQKGVANVTHPQTGVYCILPTSVPLQNGVPLGIVAPQLTLDYGNTPDETVTVTFGGTNTNYCPSLSSMIVYSYYVAPGVYQAKDAAFVLSFN